MIGRAIQTAFMAGCVLTASLAWGAPPTVQHDWSSYAGGNGAYAETSGAKLVDDIAQRKLLWTSEEKGIGYGKTSSAGGPKKEFGDLPPSGTASPIVAGGAVVVSYFVPSGDVTDEAEVVDQGGMRQRGLILADDIMLAIDAGTGKTRWKAVFEKKGVNIPMGKREGWGITPAAGDGAVFAINTLGRIYALALADGKLLWEGNVGEANAAAEKRRDQALAAKKLWPHTFNFPGIWWQVLVVNKVVVAPDLRNGLVGFDTATGKVLWRLNEKGGITTDWNMPAPVRIGTRDFVATVNFAGQLRLIGLDDGKVRWTHELKSKHLASPVALGDVILAYEGSFTSDAGMKNKRGEEVDTKEVGHLAGFRATEAGVTRMWGLPEKIRAPLGLDRGPTNRLAMRDGLVYFLEYGSEGGEGACTMHIIQATDGKILANANFAGDGGKRVMDFCLWGDRIVSISDNVHRPRKANPEMWTLWDADPKSLKRLGGSWHLNGPDSGLVPTGGYEVPQREAFADGLMFIRAAGVVQCYDLRKDR